MSRISLGTNVFAVNAQRMLAEGSAALGRTFERLSSGQRINRAADDAAGLSVASSLGTNVRVYTQGIRNANDGISLLNIADGALQQLADITTRQIELASQAANGSFSFRQRQSMQKEANSLADEFNRLVASTKFNGASVLDANLADYLRLQFGFGTDGGIGYSRNRDLSRVVGNGTFSISGATTLALSPTATGDFNGDGKTDLLSTTGISYGNGDGSFSAESMPWASANSVSAGDVNGDGKLDIVIGDTNSVKVYLNNGSGTFTQTANVSISGATIISDVGIGDFNGDGKMDVAANVFFGSPGVRTFMGDGAGGLGSIASVVTSGSTAFEIADVDRDGRADIIGSSGSITLYKSNASGGFSAGQTLLSGTYTIQVGDFNNDGYVDIFGTGSSVKLLTNSGGSTFSTSTLSSSADHTYAADMNGDGNLDFMQESSGVLSTYFGRGDGTFQNAITSSGFVDLGSGMTLIAGDFNGDGAMDVYATDVGSGFSDAYFASTTRTSNAAHVDLSTATSARDSLSSLKSQLQRILSERGSLGAFQSRITTSLDVLGSIALNSDSARSRIMDTDVAADSALLTRQQIVQQSAAAVLAQANQAPALALKLLQNA